jgi:adenylate cyclase
VSSEPQWIEAGLLDPSSPTADERRELLAWMEARGITLDEMRAACADGQLAATAADLALRPGPRLPLAEAAAAAGLTTDLARRLRITAGFAPDTSGPLVAPDEVEVFRLFGVAASFFSEDELLHFTRVVGASMRRIAEAAGEMFLRDVEAPQRSTATELERAQASLDAIGLARSASAIFEPMFLEHLDISTRETRIAREGHDDYATVPLAIGFVDLSSFTERAGSMQPDELLRFVVAFEAAASDLVTLHGGRLVKLIGDEVMFSCTNPDAACEIALGLLERNPTARGGLVHGPVVTSGGDLYGITVNLASRITDQAVPGEVLVDAGLRAGATAHGFEAAGRRQLKGFAEPVRLWSLLA